jgi:hypothetical protein
VSERIALVKDAALKAASKRGRTRHEVTPECSLVIYCVLSPTLLVASTLLLLSRYLRSNSRLPLTQKYISSSSGRRKVSLTEPCHTITDSLVIIHTPVSAYVPKLSLCSTHAGHIYVYLY